MNQELHHVIVLHLIWTFSKNKGINRFNFKRVELLVLAKWNTEILTDCSGSSGNATINQIKKKFPQQFHYLT